MVNNIIIIRNICFFKISILLQVLQECDDALDQVTGELTIKDEMSFRIAHPSSILTGLDILWMPVVIIPFVGFSYLHTYLCSRSLQ